MTQKKVLFLLTLMVLLLLGGALYLTPALAAGSYQAENAVLGGGVTVIANAAGFFGTGYLAFPSTGGYVEFRNVGGGAGGCMRLHFRYKLGTTSSRTGRLTVNGVSQDITFNPTGTTWVIHAVAVNLNDGASNTIRLASTGQFLANIDQLEVVSIVPPTTRPPYQAEDAILGGGVNIVATGTGFIGTGYVNFPANGGYVEFRNVDGGMGSNRQLEFRYKLGSTSSNTGRLTVNGVSQNITFSPTGSWSIWDYHEVIVNLNAGAANTIRLASTGQYLANLDQLQTSTSWGGGSCP